MCSVLQALVTCLVKGGLWLWALLLDWRWQSWWANEAPKEANRTRWWTCLTLRFFRSSQHKGLWFLGIHSHILPLTVQDLSKIKQCHCKKAEGLLTHSPFTSMECVGELDLLFSIQRCSDPHSMPRNTDPRLLIIRGCPAIPKANKYWG